MTNVLRTNVLRLKINMISDVVILTFIAFLVITGGLFSFTESRWIEGSIELLMGSCWLAVTMYMVIRYLLAVRTPSI